jgi:hypothetical protein
MRKRKRPSPIGNMDSFRDQSIKRNITIYTINLIKELILDQNLITQGLYCLSISSRENFISRIYPTSGKNNNDTEQLQARYEDMIDDLDNPSSLAVSIIRSINRKQTTCGISDIKKYFLEALNSELSSLSTSESMLDKRLHELAKVFKLSEEEVSILKLIFFLFLSIMISPSLFNSMHFDEFVNMVSIATGLPLSVIRKSLNKSGILVSTGIIENIDHSNNSLYPLMIQ